jgi:hypothetical protein
MRAAISYIYIYIYEVDVFDEMSKTTQSYRNNEEQIHYAALIFDIYIHQKLKK